MAKTVQWTVFSESPSNYVAKAGRIAIIVQITVAVHATTAINLSIFIAKSPQILIPGNR